jgi:hypothetical protein
VMIGHRAAVALAAAKGARGRFGQSQALEDPKNAVASIKALAAQHAAKALPVFREIRRAGAMSLHQIAGALNARGVRLVPAKYWKSFCYTRDRSRRSCRRKHLILRFF